MSATVLADNVLAVLDGAEPEALDDLFRRLTDPGGALHDWAQGVVAAVRAEQESQPKNVIQALAAIMVELPGIGKTETSEQNYQYRGIENITAHLQSLLGKHCVVFVPKVLKRRTVPLTINGRPWTQEELKVTYRVYGPGGPSDYIDVGPLWGLGRDNSDKGANKCQPPGTMVRVPAPLPGTSNKPRLGWTECPIEMLRPGDRVVTWQRTRSALRPSGRKVAGVASRPYEGRLITVTTAGSTSRYTPDHHCLVRLPLRLADGDEIVYLMRRGDQYRIGRCRWRSSNTTHKSRIGLAWRCAAVGADAAWVLSVHGSIAEATMHEALSAVRFGIPQTSFTGNTDALRSRRASAFSLETFWSKVGHNRPQASDCLAHFGRLIDRPLFERRADRSQLGMLPTIETAAGNLLPGMLLGVPTEPVSDEHGWQSWPLRWEPIGVDVAFYSGLVHSLEVEGDHNYVADGILTGNCMTQCFKYALLQVFSIGDRKDDADAEQAHEADEHPTGARTPKPKGRKGKAGDWYAQNGWAAKAEHDEWQRTIIERLRAQPAEVQNAFKAHRVEVGYGWDMLAPKAMADDLSAQLAKLTQESEKGRDETDEQARTTEPEAPVTTEPDSGDNPLMGALQATADHLAERDAHAEAERLAEKARQIAKKQGKEVHPIEPGAGGRPVAAWRRPRRS